MAVSSSPTAGTKWIIRIVSLLILVLGLLASPFLQRYASAATVSDNFTRANGGLGSNWTTVTGTVAPQIVSNTLQPGTAGTVNSAYWSANTFGSDQYAQASLPNSNGSSYGPAIAVRLSNSKGYFLWYGNSANQVSIWRMDSATSWTQLKASGSLTISATDVWKITAVGSTISAYQNGTQVATVTDTHYTTGSPGVWLYYSGNQITNWSGGDIGPYSVGGTVSGLSGTAVLQDNGGDDLTITAGGPFTFATQLAAGAAYNVTVKTSPAGQTCTVTNGTGTMASANVTNVGVACTTSSNGPASDSFNRADGGLGSNWTAMSDGAMTIRSQAVAGGNAGYSGDIWSGSTFASDQFSQVQVTSNQLTAGQWIGPAVRAQNSGQNLYLGIYFWNNGSPQLRLYLRTSGNWTQLGSSYNSGPLAAGTTLELSAAGSTISFLENNVSVITVTDTSLTGGAPGIMAYGTGQADNWSAANVAAGLSYSIGGTVSGLSGTVVLQDNGGDTLSVSSNGAFSFATPMPSGSAYSVTVANNPTGQTCTIANGSGTVGTGNVTTVAVTCANITSGSATDNFNRADGPLGSSWTGFSDGGLAITSQVVSGTNTTGYSGDMRTAETYNSNQYSQIQLTSTQLTGGQWIGPAVRMQASGQDGYVGVYYWNSGSPEVTLFERTGSTWNQLGAYSTGPLTAGTTLKLEAVGSTLAFLVNGVERIAVYDNTYAGGAPGIMASGTGQADNWSGGTAGFEVHYLSTDSNGVQTYDMISANDGYGPQFLRVLPPSNPAAGVAHNFLYALPVEPGEGTTYGDGIQTIESLNAQNQYNLTVIEPSFGIDPWYADNPVDANEQEETFMATELQPWVKANLSTTGTEQHWLIGFSKSGIGGQDLLLRHPDLFTLDASWDFPADMAAYDAFGSSSAASYGTDANFQANDRLTASFLAAHRAPFLTNNRIWIGGYQVFQQDMSDYDALLTSEGISHTLGPVQVVPHRWDGGWVAGALAGLAQDGINLH